jgi:hypothetical protein
VRVIGLYSVKLLDVAVLAAMRRERLAGSGTPARPMDAAGISAPRISAAGYDARRLTVPRAVTRGQGGQPSRGWS